jgi:hypothetical protein
MERFETSEEPRTRGTKGSCAICRSDRRATIESDLNSGLPFSEVASRNGLYKSICWRHFNLHMGLPKVSKSDPLEGHDYDTDEAKAHRTLSRALNRGEMRKAREASDTIMRIRRLRGTDRNRSSDQSCSQFSDGTLLVSFIRVALRKATDAEFSEIEAEVTSALADAWRARRGESRDTESSVKNSVLGG